MICPKCGMSKPCSLKDCGITPAKEREAERVKNLPPIELVDHKKPPVLRSKL
jgi:hypothetical protein